MKLTSAPWKVRFLSVDEMLVLCVIQYLEPIKEEIGRQRPELLAQLAAQRGFVAEIAGLLSMTNAEVLAVLRALERKQLVMSERVERMEAAQ